MESYHNPRTRNKPRQRGLRATPILVFSSMVKLSSNIFCATSAPVKSAPITTFANVVGASYFVAWNLMAVPPAPEICARMSERYQFSRMVIFESAAPNGAGGADVADAFAAGASQKKIAGISRASRASTGFFPSATS